MKSTRSAKGQRGSRGSQGVAGVAGVAGAQGATGAQGAKGEASRESRGDHDLLIEIRVKLDSVTSELATMKAELNSFMTSRADVVSRVRVLEEDAAKRNDDHETRIRKLEVWGAMAFGMVLLIQTLLKFIPGVK